MKKLIVANWKLNPATLKEAQKLAGSVSAKTKNTVVLCPPHIFLSAIAYPRLGAQDCFWHDKGAFTGQVSPLQLAKMKIKYCIIGHSERRQFGGDTDEVVNAKLKACLAGGLTPILCVGYGTAVNQDDLEVISVLKTQLDAGLKNLDAGKIIAAYEPVWAIGSGKTPPPEHAEKIAIYIKSKYGVKKVLYGGSANQVTAPDFLAQNNVDGLLVGGASLTAASFNQITEM